MIKQLFRLATTATAIVTAVSPVKAVSNIPAMITVTKVPVNTGGDPEHIEEETPEHRKPGIGIACSIDPISGIEFLGHETPDFIMYEIYDINNVCMGTYGDEPEFIEALFSLTGEYRITLSTAEVSYIGYVIL